MDAAIESSKGVALAADATAHAHAGVVEARDVTRRYGTGATVVEALRGVSLELGRARLTAIMGASGSGKSTLMHILAGLDRPTSGDVAIDGASIATLNDTQLTKLRRRHVGFVFQFFNLLPTLTVEENVLLPLALAGRSPRPDFFDELLVRVGLADRRKLAWEHRDWRCWLPTASWEARSGVRSTSRVGTVRIQRIVEETVVVRAPARVVWNAILDGDARRRWWPHLELDATSGGRVEEWWTDATGREVVTRGEIVEVVPGRRLRATWADEGGRRRRSSRSPSRRLPAAAPPSPSATAGSSGFRTATRLPRRTAPGGRCTSRTCAVRWSRPHPDRPGVDDEPHWAIALPGTVGRVRRESRDRRRRRAEGERPAR